MSEAVPRFSLKPYLRRRLPDAVLFALYFVYFWLWVDTRLLYFRPRPPFPAFLTTQRFVAHFVARPGGLIGYGAAFLSQLFCYRAVGALLLAALAALLAISICRMVTSFGLPKPRCLHVLPALVLALAYARYAHVLDIALLVFCVASLAAAFSWVGRGVAWLSAVVPIVLTVPLYYLLGGGYPLLSLTMALGEAAGRRRWVSAGAWLLLGAVLPFAAAPRLLNVALQQALYPLPLGLEPALLVKGADWLLMCCLPAAVLVGAVQRLRGEEARAPAGEGTARGGRRAQLEAAVLVLAVAGILWAAADRDERSRLRIGLMSHQGRWQDLLAEARSMTLSQSDLLTRLSVNRALYHAGRMPEDLFAYPQSRFSLVRIPEEFFHSQQLREPQPGPREFMRTSDVFFELGRVNEAEHLATEAMEDQGYRPWILERIALCRVAKGQWQSARPFLGLLSHDVIWGRRGRRYLSMMEGDPALAGVPDVRRLRATMPEQDTAEALPVTQRLEKLLERNPDNRMAMDYLMAHCLLRGDLDGFVQRLGRAVGLAGGDVPELYQEALMVYAETHTEKSQLVQSFVSSKVRARFDRFGAICARHRGDKKGAMKELVADYRQSYFPYYAFFIMAGDE